MIVDKIGKSILVTGAAGFIGFHLCKALLAENQEVTGLDNLNDYYDVNLKKNRLKILSANDKFHFVQIDLKDKASMDKLFLKSDFDVVINLAAQAGVRYSLTHPYTYLDSNLTGFLNILEASRLISVKHLIYASSSGVYGGNGKMPFSVHDNVDHPLALYAASKKANELMAHAYSNLFRLPTTGLRFFNVYGTYGRPDMALFIFTKAILENRPIDIFNFGKMKRDFTYVDDVVKAIIELIPKPSQPDPGWNPMQPDPASSFAPYRVFNIGNNKPVDLMEFIGVLENKLGKKAIKNFLPIQDGDVEETYADIQALEDETGFRPSTSIETGIDKFVNWYREYYQS